MRWWIRIFFVVLVGSFLATGLVSWRLTTRFAKTAVAHHDGAETVALHTTDGETIQSWWFDAPEARVVAVLVHGNGGSRRSMLSMAEHLSGVGCAVLAITVRAHGDSTGEKNDFGYSARNDVIAAIGHVRTRAPDRPILIVGRSLGAAATIFAAPQLGTAVGAYVLESPYESITVATKNRTDMFLPDPISTVLSYTMLSWSRLFLGVPAAVIAPIDHVGSIPKTTPVVLIAAELDRRATLRELEHYRAALVGHVVLEVFEDTDHSEPWYKDRPRYRRILDDVVRSLESR